MDRKQIVAKKQQFVYPAVSNYFTDPLPLERGEMQHVWDTEGKRYLDFFGGIVTVGVGHCEPAHHHAGEGADRQAGPYLYACTRTRPWSALAEKIAQITPGRLEKSFFTTSGTEANETAIDSARMHTGNLEIIALRHSYSGRSSLTKSLTGI
jgi:4-aminobutyrate aminotransferase-like enzyme